MNLYIFRYRGRHSAGGIAVIAETQDAAKFLIEKFLKEDESNEDIFLGPPPSERPNWKSAFCLEAELPLRGSPAEGIVFNSFACA